MYFTESRGNDGQREPRVTFSAAIMAPIASFGGIYSPEPLTPLSRAFFAEHLDSSFQALASMMSTS